MFLFHSTEPRSIGKGFPFLQSVLDEAQFLVSSNKQKNPVNCPHGFTRTRLMEIGEAVKNSYGREAYVQSEDEKTVVVFLTGVGYCVVEKARILKMEGSLYVKNHPMDR